MKLFRSCFSTCLALAISATALGQSWQAITNAPNMPNGASLPVLMTDGSVLVQEVESSNWWRYTPDANGDYLNGTWTQVASLPSGYGPLYYGSAVLPDGRLAIQGGEYNLFGDPVWTNQGAIYDPVANTWTSLAPPAGWNIIGDAQSVVLPDGTWMLAQILDARMAKFDAGNLTWSAATSNNKQDRHDEEGWTLLPDGTVFTVDCINIGHAEKYIPWTGQWVDAGNVPVQLPDEDSEEMGPQVLMFDGRVMCFGAIGHNAIYTPPATPTDPGTWTTAPDFPIEPGSGLKYDIADGPAVLLTNGKILCAASPGVFQAPTAFFEFDGTSLNQVASTPNAPFDPSFVCNFLMLPSGQVMLTDFSGDIEIYTSSGSPNDAWRPTISDAPSQVNPGGTFTLTGTQLNGLSQTNFYGDDWQNFSNYPIIRITNGTTGHVFYCRTFNTSTQAIGANSNPITTSFSVPSEIELGDGTIEVVANGIASTPQPITVSSGEFVTKDFVTSSVITFGGTPFTATMELFAPAPSGGVTVNLQSSNPALIVPPTVTVPEGADHLDFQINTLNDTYGVISASVTESYGGEPTHTITVPVYPGNRGAFLSQTVPSLMQDGSNYTVTLTYKNTSNITWDAAHAYKLQSRNPNNNLNFGKNRIQLTNAPVPPGGTGIFQTTLSPSVFPGTYNFQWLPIEDAIGAGFGQLSPNIAIQITRLANNAKFISNTTPTTVFAGNDFAPTISFNNTGGSTWSAATGYNLTTINPTGNTTWRVAKMNIPGATSVPFTATMPFTATLTAPVVPGDYTMQWQVSQFGVPFGENTPVMIVHVVNGLDNSNFLSQSVPKSVGPGVTFSASMTMKNTGTGVWDSTYALVPIGGTGFSVKKIPSNVTSPGGTSAFIQTFTAPAVVGTYTFQWRMAHNGVQFGQSTQSVTITVTNDAAQFVSKIIGTSIPAGSDFVPNFTMRNTGTTTWRQSTGYALISQNTLNNTTWGTNRLLVPAASVVTTNQSVICSNTCTAPIIPGIYTMQWQMSKNGVVFGELTPLLSITVTAAADNAQFVTQSGIPTTIARGGAFIASVTMKNIGSATWDSNYSLVPVGDSSFGVVGISGATTAPNGSKVFTTTFTVPASPGKYKFTMRMKHTSTKFGQASPVVTITVT